MNINRRPASSNALSTFADEKLFGTWKLVGAVNEDQATGQKTDIYKGAPVGFINFAPDGKFIVS
jgi:hypothetical protein